MLRAAKHVRYPSPLLAEFLPVSRITQTHNAPSMYCAPHWCIIMHPTCEKVVRSALATRSEACALPFASVGRVSLRGRKLTTPTADSRMRRPTLVRSHDMFHVVSRTLLVRLL